MKPFEETFPHCRENVSDWGYRDIEDRPSYDALVSAWGFEILTEKHDSDYQGDSRYLLKDATTGHIGYLEFGWGSCSGCDALEGCDTVEELKTLYASLYDSVKWFTSAAQALAFFIDHDWEGDYSWHAREQREFVQHVLDLLADQVTEKGEALVAQWLAREAA